MVNGLSFIIARVVIYHTLYRFIFKCQVVVNKKTTLAITGTVNVIYGSNSIRTVDVRVNGMSFLSLHTRLVVLLSCCQIGKC